MIRQLRRIYDNFSAINKMVMTPGAGFDYHFYYFIPIIILHILVTVSEGLFYVSISGVLITLQSHKVCNIKHV